MWSVIHLALVEGMCPWMFYLPFAELTRRYCYPRVCPGMQLANRSIFIALALVLWSFRIVERPEAPIDTTPDNDNVQSHLADFKVNFVPRIKEARLREMVAM